jgi:large subunit ribosomal protein L22e
MAATAVAARPTTNVPTINKKKSTGGAPLKFTIDCSRPVADEIFDIAAFDTFLHDRFKVDGKSGNLGTSVEIRREKDRIIVSAASGVSFSKRYLKYLTKKYLKKNQLRDWLHVIASDKFTYQLRYFNIDQEEEEEAGNADENDEE